MIEYRASGLDFNDGGVDDQAILLDNINVPNWLGATGSVYTVVIHGIMPYIHNAGQTRNILHWSDRWHLVNSSSSTAALGLTDAKVLMNKGFGGASFLMPTGVFGTLVMTYDGPNQTVQLFYANDTMSRSGVLHDLSTEDLSVNQTGVLNIGGTSRMSGPLALSRGFHGIISSIAFLKDVKYTLEEVEWIQSKKDPWAGLNYLPSGIISYPSGIDNRASTLTDYLIFPLFPMTDVTSVFNSSSIKGGLIGEHVNVGSGILTWINGNPATTGTFGNVFGPITEVDRWAGAYFAGGATGSPVYIDPYTHGPDDTFSSQGFFASGHFLKDFPSYIFSASGVSGNATVVAALANNELPRPGYDRFLAWSNSRGARQHNANLRTYSENHFNGYFLNRADKFRGVINVPCTISTAPPTMPCFPNLEGILHNASMITSIPRLASFERLWANSVSFPATGPGNGVVLESGNTFNLMSTTATGTLYTNDVTRTMEIVALAYPGGPTILNPFYIKGSDSNSIVGFLTPETELLSSGLPTTLDTAVFTRTFQASADSYESAGGKRLEFENLVSGSLIQPGWGVYCGSDAVLSNNEGLFYIVSGVVISGTTTKVYVYNEHAPTLEAPDGGEVFSFGPLSFEKYSMTVNSGLTSDFFGMSFNYTNGDNNKPAFLYCANAWANDVSGFIGGPAGWGGAGYTLQIGAANHSGWISNIVDTLSVNDIILHMATQSTDQVGYLAFADSVAETNATPIFVIDQQHDIDESIQETWGNAVLGQSAYAGAVAGSYNIGSARYQMTRGWKTDEPHPNIFGMIEIAKEQLPILSNYLINMTPVEFNGLTPITRYTSKIFSSLTSNVTRASVSGPLSSRNDYISRPLGNFTEGGVNEKLGDTEALKNNFDVQTGAFNSVISTGVVYGSSDDSNAKAHEFSYREGSRVIQDSIERD